MFPTKTNRDVGMVHCVSETTGSCMEKTTGTKSPGTRRCICDIVAIQEFRKFRNSDRITLGYLI